MSYDICGASGKDKSGKEQVCSKLPNHKGGHVSASGIRFYAAMKAHEHSWECLDASGRCMITGEV